MGIDPAHLVLLGTHNHQAPIQIVPDNFDYGRMLADRIYELVERAIKNEDGPVTLHFGSGHGNFSPRSGSAHVDYEIQLLKVMKGDQPVAFLFNHPTHPLSGPPGYGPHILVLAWMRWKRSFQARLLSTAMAVEVISSACLQKVSRTLWRHVNIAVMSWRPKC